MREFAIVDRGALHRDVRDQGVSTSCRSNRLTTARGRQRQQGSPPDVSQLEDLAAGSTTTIPTIKDVFPYLEILPVPFRRSADRPRKGEASEISGFPDLAVTPAAFSRSTTSTPRRSAPSDEQRSRRARVQAGRPGDSAVLRSWPVALARGDGLRLPLDPNEGWNAYHAAAAMSGAPLYPVARVS